jgi:ABC-type dipeptide/oligopeptide/nickel transport system ATPase subunit
VTPLVAVRGVSHRFEAKLALEDVSLALAPGERVGITGPSGCGKSTLARILTLHLRPQSGVVLVDGVLCWGLRQQEYRIQRKQLQLVFQDPGNSFAHHWKLWQVVAEGAAIAGYPPNEQREIGLQLMNRVKLNLEYAERSPLELSGGERRRAAIARALGVHPRLLVLDESLSGLDGPVQTEIMAILDQLCAQEKLTLVTVSHDPRVLRRLSDRVVVLNEGRLVEDTAAGVFFREPSSALGRRLLDAAYWSSPEWSRPE